MPPQPAIPPLVRYKNWNSKFVEWTVDVPEDEDSEEEEVPEAEASQ